jgi:hypothetical protein
MSDRRPPVLGQRSAMKVTTMVCNRNGNPVRSVVLGGRVEQHYALVDLSQSRQV